MIEDYLHRPWVVAQLRASLFGSDLDGLSEELQGFGYSVATIQNHLHAAGHLAYWLEQKRVHLRSLDEAMLRGFVERHLPHCRCPIPRGNPRKVEGEVQGSVVPYMPQIW